MIYRDLYNLCQYEDFIIDKNEEPADFPPVERLEIDLVRQMIFIHRQLRLIVETNKPKLTPEKVIPFVCDFIVEYINSDVLVRFFLYQTRTALKAIIRVSFPIGI